MPASHFSRAWSWITAWRWVKVPRPLSSPAVSHSLYVPFFGLAQPPFSIAPDPRYLFMSERHREALAHLLYGVKGAGGGFVLLTGEISDELFGYKYTDYAPTADAFQQESQKRIRELGEVPGPSFVLQPE